MTIPAATLKRLTGTEPVGPWPAGKKHSLLEFWQWACSDVLNNTLRGLLAEWLVGTALGVTDGWRTEWAAEDLRTRDGTTIEVKSAAYVQAWAQKKASSIRFGIAPTTKWDGATGTYGQRPERSAQVYVFCLLGERDPQKVDPLDTRQWEFFVLPSAVLDAEVPGQKTVGLSSLRRLAAVQVGIEGLAEAIRAAPSRG